MCKKASQKLYALARIAPLMDLKRRRNVMKAFVESQFKYCPLTWMFHSRELNKINRAHERVLRSDMVKHEVRVMSYELKA